MRINTSPSVLGRSTVAAENRAVCREIACFLRSILHLKLLMSSRNSEAFKTFHRSISNYEVHLNDLVGGLVARNIGFLIIPIDELTFFQRRKTTNQMTKKCLVSGLRCPQKNLDVPGMETEIQRDRRRDGEIVEVAGGSEA